MSQDNNAMNATYNAHTKENTVDIVMLYNLYNFDSMNLWLLVDFDSVRASKVITG